MGKTFRKNSNHNKFARRDSVAKEKFVKKFLQPAHKKSRPDALPKDVKFPEND